MKLQTDKKSGLKYMFNPGNPDKPTVVIFHGYGANAADLYSISELVSIKGLNYNWLFLEGAEAPPQIAAFGGRAWFNVDIEHFQRLVAENKFKEYYSREPENIDLLHKKISLFLDSMKLDQKDVILAGFSQGAMVCTDFICSAKYKPRALIFMSGTVIRQHKWIESNMLKDLKIFQSHGDKDPVLPAQGAKHFRSLTQSKSHELHLFNGGHEIPVEILTKCKDFLKSLERVPNN